jgi:hypothetical protein
MNAQPAGRRECRWRYRFREPEDNVTGGPVARTGSGPHGKNSPSYLETSLLTFVCSHDVLEYEQADR